MNQPRRRVSLADLVLIAALALAVGAGLAAQTGAGRGHHAVIQVDGETKRHLSLHRDGVYRIRGPAGESLLEVADGQVRIVEAPCRRKLCIRRGWLGSAGATTTCLPNRLHVRVEGNEDRYDAVNY